MGWTASATRTPGRLRASSTEPAQVGVSQAEVTTRVTPTSAARATSSAAVSGSWLPGPLAGSPGTGR